MDSMGSGPSPILTALLYIHIPVPEIQLLRSYSSPLDIDLQHMSPSLVAQN